MDDSGGLAAQPSGQSSAATPTCEGASACGGSAARVNAASAIVRKNLIFPGGVHLESDLRIIWFTAFSDFRNELRFHVSYSVSDLFNFFLQFGVRDKPADLRQRWL